MSSQPCLPLAGSTSTAWKVVSQPLSVRTGGAAAGQPCHWQTAPARRQAVGWSCPNASSPATRRSRHRSGSRPPRLYTVKGRSSRTYLPPINSGSSTILRRSGVDRLSTSKCSRSSVTSEMLLVYASSLVVPPYIPPFVFAYILIIDGLAHPDKAGKPTLRADFCSSFIQRREATSALRTCLPCAFLFFSNAAGSNSRAPSCFLLCRIITSYWRLS